MSSMHLIRFPNKKEHKRAIMAFMEVPHTESLGLPGFQMVVTDDHIQALERDKVSFTYLSKTSPNVLRLRKKKTLAQMVAGITPENLHREWNTGFNVGNEAM